MSTAADVTVGAGVALGGGVGSQVVAKGGFNGLSWSAVGIDTAIGGIAPGAGGVAAAAGVGNVVNTVGTDVLGGIGTVAAFTGGRC